MDVGSLIADLKEEAEKISTAIAALTGLGATKAVRKKRARASRAMPSKKKSGGMTPAGRKRLSMLMKKRWAERKKRGSQSL